MEVVAVSSDCSRSIVEVCSSTPRVCLAASGHPVVGDLKAAKAAGKGQQGKGLYLSLVALDCEHPVPEAGGDIVIQVRVDEPTKFRKLVK